MAALPQAAWWSWCRRWHLAAALAHARCWDPRSLVLRTQMRIDYWLVSEDLDGQVETVEICGKGKEKEDFMGSDHCPILLKMKGSRMEP